MYRDRTYFNVNLDVPSAEKTHMPYSVQWANFHGNIPNASNIVNTEEPARLLNSINTTAGAEKNQTVGNQSNQGGHADSINVPELREPNKENDIDTRNPDDLVHTSGGAQNDLTFGSNTTQDANAPMSDDEENELYEDAVNYPEVREPNQEHSINPRNTTNLETISEEPAHNLSSYTPKTKKTESENVCTCRESIFMQSLKGLVHRPTPLPSRNGSRTDDRYSRNAENNTNLDGDVNVHKVDTDFGKTLYYLLFQIHFYLKYFLLQTKVFEIQNAKYFLKSISKTL